MESSINEKELIISKELVLDVLHHLETTDNLYCSDLEDFKEYWQIDNTELEEKLKKVLGL